MKTLFEAKFIYNLSLIDRYRYIYILHFLNIMPDSNNRLIIPIYLKFSRKLYCFIKYKRYLFEYIQCKYSGLY